MKSTTIIGLVAATLLSVVAQASDKEVQVPPQVMPIEAIAPGGRKLTPPPIHTTQVVKNAAGNPQRLVSAPPVEAIPQQLHRDPRAANVYIIESGGGGAPVEGRQVPPKKELKNFCETLAGNPQQLFRSSINSLEFIFGNGGRHGNNVNTGDLLLLTDTTAVNRADGSASSAIYNYRTGQFFTITRVIHEGRPKNELNPFMLDLKNIVSDYGNYIDHRFNENVGARVYLCNRFAQTKFLN